MKVFCVFEQFQNCVPRLDKIFSNVDCASKYASEMMSFHHGDYIWYINVFDVEDHY